MRPFAPAAWAVCLAVACIGCQGDGQPSGRESPPVDQQPVTELAGFGMELRVWALHTPAWQRARQGERLKALYDQWQAIQAQAGPADADPVESVPASPDPGPRGPDAGEGSSQAPAEPATGPPLTPEATVPESFEAFVRQHGSALHDPANLDVLDRYADLRDALDPHAAALWAGNGLRLALVPLEDLASVRQALGVPAAKERTWFGSVRAWAHVVQGPDQPQRVVETDAGLLTLGPGSLALLGRAWPAPGDRAPVLALELCPQFVPHRPADDRLGQRLRLRLDDAPAGPLDHSALHAGPMFRRLLLRGAIPRGYALVIAPSPTPAAATPGTTGSPTAGPAVPTVGLAEAMLSAADRPPSTGHGPDWAGVQASHRQLVALVIVPVLPEWYALDAMR
ncbi:MAG: hypothetical protein KatS3mg103_1291 [Phycisphaerales bacterium]|nr:MAG: hypothetical protein KatS3mg103_1291 [Phycisphaerales bacterium]